MALERGKIWQKKNSIVLLVVCRRLPKKIQRSPPTQHNIHASFDNRPFIVQLLWLPLWMVLIFFSFANKITFQQWQSIPCGFTRDIYDF